MTSSLTGRRDIGVYAYSQGTSKTLDVATDWNAGTFSSTTTNGSGDLVLAASGGGYVTAGTWQSPTYDSGGTSYSAIYGLLTATAANASSANLALGKASSESSQYPGGPPSNGNDGNTNPNWSAGSIFHTLYEQAWWQVDLGAVYNVNSINLFNRTDCCINRADNAWVLMSQTPFASNAATAAGLAASKAAAGVTSMQVSGTVGSPTTFNLGTPLATRYVRVWLNTYDYLQLAEVQVIGTAIGGMSYQVAAADASTGPWSFVGPDGTAGSSYAVNSTSPFPYNADGHRYFRVKVSLTGDGTSTPIFQKLAMNYALPAVARSSGGSYPITAPAGTTAWVARIESADTVFKNQLTNMVLGTGSAWSTTSASFSFDSPQTVCCSANYVNVTSGAAVNTGAAAIANYSGMGGGAISVYVNRSNAIAATGQLLVSVPASSGIVVQLPLAISLP